MPRNNEYLQKQSKQADLRGGPSPAQASDAPAAESPQPNHHNHQTAANRLSIDSAAPTANKTSDFATVLKRLSASYAAAKSTAAAIRETTPTATTTTTKQSPASSECSASSFTHQPKVSLSRLRFDHVQSMETSLTEFAKQDPEVAIKLGVIEKPPEPMDESRRMRDMFTMMKADGRAWYLIFHI